MALDLSKLSKHLEMGDEDMAVLALRTFVKTNVPSQPQERPLLTSINDALKKLIASDEHEVRFFARQAMEKIAAMAEETGGPLDPVVPSSGPNLPDEKSAQGSKIAPGLAEVAKMAIDAVGSLSWPGIMTTEASRAMVKLNALSQAGDEQSSAQVCEMLTATTDPWIRATCVSTLGKIGATSSLRVLVVALRDTDARVRANAVEAVATISPRDRCIKVYMEAVADSDPRVRANGLKGLAQMDLSKVFGELSRMVDSEKISARATAVHVLGAIRDPRSLTLLETLADDDAEEIRMRVVDALDNQQCLEAVGIVRKLVNDMDIDVAERALHVYELRKDEAGLFDSKELSLAIIQEEVSRVDAEEDQGPTASAMAKALLTPSVRAPEAPVRSDTQNAAPSQAAPAEAPPPSVPDQAPSPTEAQREDPAHATGARRIVEAALEGETPSWPEPSEVAEALHVIYDEIDEILAAMGKKIVSLEKSKGFRGGGHFDRLLYQVRRYEDMIEKRLAAASQVGFFEKFVRRGDPGKDPGMLELQTKLFNQHRELGERCIGLQFDQKLRFPQLQSEYKKVDKLLEKANVVKLGKGKPDLDGSKA